MVRSLGWYIVTFAFSILAVFISVLFVALTASWSFTGGHQTTVVEIASFLLLGLSVLIVPNFIYALSKKTTRLRLIYLIYIASPFILLLLFNILIDWLFCSTYPNHWG